MLLNPLCTLWLNFISGNRKVDYPTKLERFENLNLFKKTFA